MDIIVRRAASSDIDNIHQILKPYANEGIILERSREDISKDLNFFFVAEKNSEIIGIVSYYNYGEKLKEVRALAVKRDSYRMGVGAALLKALLISLQKDFPKAKIFALSYYPEFFNIHAFCLIFIELLM